MTGAKRAWAAAAAAATLAVGSGAASDSRNAFGVGVLRRDGVIVPFAAFDGKRWSHRWPEPELDLVVPIDVSGVPKKWWGPTPPLAAWQAWIDGASRLLRVVQPDWVNVHCVRQVGLRTDYKAALAAPPRDMQPYPKDGLAVSPPRDVEPIAIVSPTSNEARALIATVQESFNMAERRVEEAGGHPVARRAREGRAIDVEAVYAVSEHPRIYYVEALRPYRRLGQEPDACEAVGFGTGWFARDGQQVRPLSMIVDVLPCSRAGAAYMLPFGVIRVKDKTYWLAQFSGWNHERYVVIDIQPKTVEAVLGVWGGGCDD